MPASQQSFGHKELAAELIKRLQIHFNDEQSAQSGVDSLVIGVFGEWGSGKSNLLQLLHEGFKPTKPDQDAEKKNKDKPELPVIVIPFNPWRYEKEEHLILPLFKVMELEITRQAKQKDKARWKQAGRFMLLSGLAFIKAFKAKVTLGDYEVEFDPEKFLIGGESALEGKPVPALMSGLQSFYFEFEQGLKEYTQGEDPFRLLFLIDDLDRCLPEKAVEMLEAIKLFLDVEGCAFVLALDDEVVERGIVHRYRDYIFQGNRAMTERGLAQLPITGAEYLEKIIHLPFRLPQPSKRDMRHFLQKRFADLFGSTASHELLETQEVMANSRHMGKEGQKTDTALLELFVNNIPPVPRKQIRVGELLRLLRNIAASRGCAQRIELLPLAELTLLQLFAPDLYRFGRRRYPGFMKTLQDWSKQHKEHWGQRGFSKALKTILTEQNNQKEQGKEEQSKADKESLLRRYDRHYLPLLNILEVVTHNRSGFDPLKLIEEATFPKLDVKTQELYFSFVDEVSQLEADKQALAQQEEDKRERTQFSNHNELLDLLFSDMEGDWQSALQLSGLENRLLSDDVFATLQQNLDDDFLQKLQGRELIWLGGLLPHLSSQHLQTLLENAFTDLLVALPEEATKDNHEPVFQQATFLIKINDNPYQRSLLADDIEQMQSWLQTIVKEHLLAIEPRAKAGRLLSELGDPRKGVGSKPSKTNSERLVPDIDWQYIPAGTFQMGLPKNEKKTNWDKYAQPQHSVSIEKPFYISRYPVTNAQYQCFVDAGMYQDEAFWQSLPAAAYHWWQGSEADEELLKTITEKDVQENYRNWLRNDKDRRTPYYFSDQKWNHRNHPVVGVCWFEALAYSTWLNRVLADVHPYAQTQGKIRLPYEEEWEFAARGIDNRLYPWKGNEISASHANYNDTGLGRTSAVGLFPKSDDAGLYDMAGNTWEWMQSRWGADLGSPDFTYKNWESPEERNDINPVEARIVRGGSWDVTSDDLRSAFRLGNHPDVRFNNIGFRVVFVEF